MVKYRVGRKLKKAVKITMLCMSKKRSWPNTHNGKEYRMKRKKRLPVLASEMIKDILVFYSPLLKGSF